MRLAAILALLLLPTALSAQEIPSPWRVTGVVAGDVLNIRAAPSGSAQILGGFAPGAGPIEVTGWDEGRRWARVISGEIDGWVFARFLAPDAWVNLPGSSFPARMDCGGTEPFWDAKPRGGDLEFMRSGEPATRLRISSIKPASGRFWPQVIAAGELETQAFLTVTPRICSDGMSDRNYGWSATLIETDGGETRLLEGCCRIPNP